MKHISDSFKYTFITLLLLMFGTQASFAQKLFLEDFNGRPLRVGQYSDVEGSPYLQDDWSKGSVSLGNGETVDNVELKYDQVADVLLFKNKAGDPMEFVQAVPQFEIAYAADGKTETRTYRKNFTPVTGATDQSYYQVLADGDVKLLKRTSKVVREEKAYNSATITKKILENVNYYLSKGNSMVKIKNNEKGVLSELSDKEDRLKNYIKENKLNLKEDEDLAKLVSYYNSLK